MKDNRYMRRALRLAKEGRYSTSPNPMVGCVIARDDVVLGKGFHRRAGEPHAEVEAIRSASESLSGSTAYVSLEPCNHEGRTPPCTDALIEAGIARVVVATRDPDSESAGGVERLRDAGITVDVGCLEDAAKQLNERFLYSARTGKPFVILKAGMTLDGKLATPGRTSKWITSEEARDRSLRLREECDGILVGAGTIDTDNPRLTRRLGLNSALTPWTRVVLDSARGIAADATLLTDGGRTIIFTPDPTRYEEKEHLAVRPFNRASGLEPVLEELGGMGLRSLIVEGGGGIHTSFISEKMWQKMCLFVAPMILGGPQAPAFYQADDIRELTAAHRFRFDAVEQIGPDLLLTGYPT